jgi:tryptophanyl-tRNA synthetase
VLPEAVIGEDTAVLKGLDGRKMSKSYNNTIPLFADEKRLRKLIMKIKTNSLEPGEPKSTEDSTLYDIYKAFATADETREIEAKYANGIAWGEMKQTLFEYINDTIASSQTRPWSRPNCSKVPPAHATSRHHSSIRFVPPLGFEN